MSSRKTKKVKASKVSDQQTETDLLINNEDTQRLGESQESPKHIDPDLNTNSDEANTSVTTKIIETYLSKNPDESSSVILQSTPKKVIASNIELILPETTLKDKSFATPQKENTLIDKNNKEVSKISLELDISKKAIEKLIEDYLAKDLIQETVSNALIPDTRPKEPVSEEEVVSATPFQNHPKYTAGKKFNLEGETIEWNSSSDEENSKPQQKNRKKQKVPEASLNNDKDTSQPASSRVSPVIERKKRNETNNGKKKTRFPWQPEEFAALEEGMILHGTKWAMIIADHGPNGRLDQRLAKRSQMQLKDKARTERQARERAGRPLGIFSIACAHV